MADAGQDPLGTVVPFERYRDVEFIGLRLRVSVPDEVLETGQHGVSPTVVVYEIVDGKRGRFVANVFRLNSSRALGRFNIHIERTLTPREREAVVAMVREWWQRRRGGKATDPARWSSTVRPGQ